MENVNDKCLSHEMYVLCDNDCRYISLANDTNDILFQNYEFPDELRIKQNLTRPFIVYEQYKALIL